MKKNYYDENYWRSVEEQSEREDRTEPSYWYGPFESMDAYDAFIDYGKHLQEFGTAGRKDRFAMLKQAAETLHAHEFQELVHRALGLEGAHQLTEIKTKISEKWLRKHGNDDSAA